MTYATCPDCGSIGRYHYGLCKLGDQPRVELVETTEGQQTAVRPEWAQQVEAEASEEADRERRLLAAAAEATAAKHAPRMTKTKLLDDAKATVADRGVAYGGVEDNFARIARLWNTHILNRTGQESELTPADVAMMMVLMKTARLENQPNHPDSWTDIAGYAACGAEITGLTSLSDLP